jgi:electron transport complex protein RnfE
MENEKTIQPVKKKPSITLSQVYVNGFWKNNPILVMLLGMCPTLAVTGSAINGLGMGIATMFVLTLANTVISILRKFIPHSMRIPAFIVLIATFVTVVDLIMQAYTPMLSKNLGIFIPLIVVNCIILGRAEAFAYKNSVFFSINDGIAMGLGFTIILVIMGSIREVLGAGSVFGISLFGEHFNPALVMILPPGAFLTIGYMVGLYHYINSKKAQKA